MKCKYCGKDIRPVGANLESLDGSEYACPKSVSKKHTIASDKVHCIFCGREVKKLGDRLVTSLGLSCSASPAGRHSL